MLNDLMYPFKKISEKDMNFLLDTHQLKDGVYIKLNSHLSWEENLKNWEERHIFFKRNANQPVIEKHDLYQWFRIRDYYSSVLNDDSNKYIDLPARLIANTNIYSLFMKKDAILGKTETKAYGYMKPEDVQNHVENFYLKLDTQGMTDKFLSLFSFAKGKVLKEQLFQTHYEYLYTYIQSQDREEKRQRNSQFFRQHITHFLSLLEQHTSQYEGYVKIFFEEEVETYQKEYELYILPKIFNVNDFNELTEEGIIGLPSYDMTVNVKKPYMQLKSMKTNIPLRTSLEEALLRKDLAKWLETKGKFKEFEIPYDLAEDKKEIITSTYHIRLDQGGGIEYFDNVPLKNDSSFYFVFKNILNIEEKDGEHYSIIANRDIFNRLELENEMNKYFFQGRLSGNYLSKDLDIKEKEFTAYMRFSLLQSRDALYDFFRKGVQASLRSQIDSLTSQLIEDQLDKTTEGLYLKKLGMAFNLRISLLQYFNLKGGIKVEENMQRLYQELKEKLQRLEPAFVEHDAEFYFLAGQVAYYLISQSESSKRDFGMFEPILRSKKSSHLKSKIDQLFMTYNHAIGIKNISFKNAMGMIMGWNKEDKVEGINRDMLLAGIFSNNLFYMKKENKEDEVHE